MYSLMLVQVHSLERECFIQRDGSFTFIVMETGWWGHALHLLYFHLILHRRQDISSSIHTVQQQCSQEASEEEGCHFHTFILCVFRKVPQFACSTFPRYSRECVRVNFFHSLHHSDVWILLWFHTFGWGVSTLAANIISKRPTQGCTIKGKLIYSMKWKYTSTVNYNYSTQYADCEIATSFNTCTWAYICCDTRSGEFKMEYII